MARISFLGDSNTNTYPKKEFDRHGHPSFCRLVADAVGAAYDSYARCGSSFCGAEEASDARQGFIYPSDFRAFEKMRRAEGATQPDVVALYLGTNDVFFLQKRPGSQRSGKECVLLWSGSLRAALRLSPSW